MSSFDPDTASAESGSVTQEANAVLPDPSLLLIQLSLLRESLLLLLLKPLSLLILATERARRRTRTRILKLGVVAFWRQFLPGKPGQDPTTQIRAFADSSLLSTMPKRPSSTPKRLKSYLPVGVLIQEPESTTRSEETDDITYFYVKEHLSSSSSRNTLFVANCPVIPRLRTSVVLQALLGRYGDVQRVTVVENPRKQASSTTTIPSVTTEWTTDYSAPHFLLPAAEEGKFAHVVFSSPKELKKALRALESAMADTASPYLTLDPIEIQTLRDDDATKEDATMQDGDNDDDTTAGQYGRVLALAERYRTSAPSRDDLLVECNRVMETYEAEVARQEQERLEQSAMPDEDGFIPVSYSNTAHKKQEGLEANDDGNQRKSSKKSRSRKKKKVEALTDFYRFQTKEQRKKNVEQLRDRFEKDLAQMKKLREEQKNKPF